ncbi:Cuticle protein 14 isoform b [Araneus ventricosus]|uniref:Cuticle protein 14 isoform b n=1 Tax=Araneus ventricosus TaxID=182803 RepID=A0A4Y2CWL0_ARAVE|nr:Cuticle protein 14 isoform b [Araneus ventricosus]
MQVLVFVALFAFSQATLPFAIRTGDSSQYKSEDNIGNYNFGYDESHISGGSFRKEAGDAYGNKYGSYGLTEADGRTRVVNYVADAGGFRADIKTNEPGIESKNPAAASINKAFYSSTYIAPAAPTTYAVATAPVKTYSYAYAPTAYKTYAAAPTTYKTYEAAPVATTYKTYAAAPKTYSYTYSAAAAPFSYGIAPAAYKVASGPAFTYAAAPAPFNTYAPVRFYTGASYIK